uniref:YqaJ viral recombinase domain-containing protein n=1 Tax=Leptobrachium leishanense TaxID=445787 RepID=A0A8C5PAV4_9ANUR
MGLPEEDMPLPKPAGTRKTMSSASRNAKQTCVTATSPPSQYKVLKVKASPRNGKPLSETTPRSPTEGKAGGANARPGKSICPISASETYNLKSFQNTPTNYRDKPSSSLGSDDERKAPAIKHQPGSAPTTRRRPGIPSRSQIVLESQLSLEDIEKVEKDTRGQSGNPEWFKLRQNRITASLAHQISHSRFANNKTMEIPQSYLKAVLGTGPRVQTTAMNWGIKNERNAVHAYEKLVSLKTGKQVQVEECGLYIHPKKNWLAASPDGVVRDVLTGDMLYILEVKCPHKHKDHTIREACDDRQFCLRPDGNSYQLRIDHPYYTQVQCQLAVTNMQHADFVVYTNKDLAVVPVTFNAELWKETEPKLEKFYYEAVLPKLNGRGKDIRELEVAGVWAAEE